MRAAAEGRGAWDWAARDWRARQVCVCGVRQRRKPPFYLVLVATGCCRLLRDLLARPRQAAAKKNRAAEELYMLYISRISQIAGRIEVRFKFFKKGHPKGFF